MSNSKLMAVPYAYHSVTADRLTGGSTSNVSTPGSPSNSWLLVGNNGTNVDRDKLGNTDSMDLKVVTNNTERMRVYGSGDINISKSARVANNLLVENNTELNKTGGATINNGAFTVTRQSPTLLSGILTVDGATDLNNALNVDGITDLNSRLNVNFKSATYLSGNLNVKGVTDLDSAFNVNNARPSLLTGTLEVRLDALLKEKLKVK